MDAALQSAELLLRTRERAVSLQGLSHRFVNSRLISRFLEAPTIQRLLILFGRKACFSRGARMRFSSY